MKGEFVSLGEGSFIYPPIWQDRQICLIRQQRRIALEVNEL
jgi:hypothetical protein